MKIAKILEQLNEHVVEISKFIASAGLTDISIDHIQIQCRTPEDYDRLVTSLEEISNMIESSEINGTEQKYFELFESIPTDIGELKMLIVKQPIPNTIHSSYGIDKISLLCVDINGAESALSAQDVRIIKTKEGRIIAKSNDVEIIFTSVSTYDDVNKRNKPSSKDELINDLQKQISQLERQKDELEAEKTAKIQLMADFQNYRKRMEKERESFGLMANMSIANEILDVLDDLKRVIEDREKDMEQCEQMFAIVKDKLMATINNIGIEIMPIEKGDKFDSGIMEAIGTINVESVDDHNRVIEVIQPAYKYSNRDQMLRPARVIVGKKEIVRGKVITD